MSADNLKGIKTIEMYCGRKTITLVTGNASHQAVSHHPITEYFPARPIVFYSSHDTWWCVDMNQQPSSSFLFFFINSNSHYIPSNNFKTFCSITYHQFVVVITAFFIALGFQYKINVRNPLKNIPHLSQQNLNTQILQCPYKTHKLLIFQTQLQTVRLFE